MKKLIAAILSICCVAAVACGCGYTDALDQQRSATQATEAQSTEDEAVDNVNAADFEDSFDGLCEYFNKKLYTVAKETDTPSVTEMDAALIGAVQGKKYALTYNGTSITVELYEYDPENLNDTANEVISSVKTDGTFTIKSEYEGETLELPAVTAYLSDNGKYLMIYTDSSINAENPDTTSDSYTHREEVIENFKAFHSN
jgi:hypothetical protein